MKCSYKFILLTSLPALLIGAEPSAFGAGNLESPSPYGLTSSEKALLETKKKLTQVSAKSNNQASQLDSLRERIDGLQSVLESMSRKSHNNKIELQKLYELNSEFTDANQEYQKRVSELLEQNTLDTKEIKKELEALQISLEKISKEYVSKEQFNELVEDINSFKKLVSEELKGTQKKQGSTKKEQKLSSAEIYNRAKMNFDRKYYTNAIEDYEYLIEHNYKPAYAHYMIGEMNFRRKNYANAISYFKKSASLYSKASYMPELMLHTAISMKESGDTQNAKTFFDAVIKKYPQSNEAKEAEKYLTSL